MANKDDYIQRVHAVIHQLHGCASTWIKSVPVVVASQGKIVWDRDVEVFHVKHPRAQECYVWTTSDTKSTVVLGIPPATSPFEAVKALMAAEKRNKKSPRGGIGNPAR